MPVVATRNEMHDTAETQVSELVAITKRLISLFSEENSYLARQNVASILPLQNEKNALLDRYARHVALLQEDTEALHALTPEIKAQLSEILRYFQNIVAENRRALAIARDARTFVVQALREAVLYERDIHQSYTAEGEGTAVLYQTGTARAAALFDQNL
ncbi:MAG: hypothetical protein ACK5UY_09010 [Holosporales bacterium]|jgi:seryl-tRNA synthetase